MNVVHSWMGYLYEVSEIKHLAAESSLKYPIIGLLERKNEVSNIKLEYLHPYFEYKRIDFYWEVGCVKNYMEMKYIRDSKVDVQKILNDVFRLALLKDENINKYFLVCGRVEDFQKYFQKNSGNEKSIEEVEGKIKILQSKDEKYNIFDSFFSFDVDSNTKIVEQHEESSGYFKTFKDEYASRCHSDYSIPNEIIITTKLVQPIDKGLRSAVAIWKIIS